MRPPRARALSNVGCLVQRFYKLRKLLVKRENIPTPSIALGGQDAVDKIKGTCRIQRKSLDRYVLPPTRRLVEQNAQALVNALARNMIDALQHINAFRQYLDCHFDTANNRLFNLRGLGLDIFQKVAQHGICIQQSLIIEHALPPLREQTLRPPAQASLHLHTLPASHAHEQPRLFLAEQAQ